MKIAISPFSCKSRNHKIPDELFIEGNEENLLSWWRQFNGSFANIVVSPEQLLKLIEHGCAYTTWHTQFRHERNFICGQHLAVDIDKTDKPSLMAIVESNKFIQQYASFLHTTPSHNNNSLKARVFFVLSQPIYDKSLYGLYASAFAKAAIKNSDISCSDPARFYFGCGPTNKSTLFLGNTLPNYVALTEVVYPYKQELDAVRQEKVEKLKLFSSNSDFDISELQLILLKQRLLHELMICPDGEKHHRLLQISRTFGGYIASGYFNELDIENDIYRTIVKRRLKNANLARQTIAKGIEYGKKEPLFLTVNYQLK